MRRALPETNFYRQKRLTPEHRKYIDNKWRQQSDAQFYIMAKHFQRVLKFIELDSRVPHEVRFHVKQLMRDMEKDLSND